MLPQTVNVEVPQFNSRMIPETEQEAMFGSLSVEDVQTSKIMTFLLIVFFSNGCLNEIFKELPVFCIYTYNTYCTCIYGLVRKDEINLSIRNQGYVRTIFNSTGIG